MAGYIDEFYVYFRERAIRIFLCFVTTIFPSCKASSSRVSATYELKVHLKTIPRSLGYPLEYLLVRSVRVTLSDMLSCGGDKNYMVAKNVRVHFLRHVLHSSKKL